MASEGEYSPEPALNPAEHHDAAHVCTQVCPLFLCAPSMPSRADVYEEFLRVPQVNGERLTGHSEGSYKGATPEALRLPLRASTELRK